MPSVLCSHWPAIMIVLGVLLAGCAAPHGEDLKSQPQVDANHHLPTVPPLAGSSQPILMSHTPGEKMLFRARLRTAD